MMNDDLIDPYNFIDIVKDTNLYGHERAFEKLEKLDCDEIIRIANEPFFTQENIDSIFGEHIDFTKSGDKRFVPTKEEKIRIATILISAKAHIFILIEGPTSSSKTYSVFIAFNIFINTSYYKNMQIALYQNSKSKSQNSILLRINLSEDSSKEDFIGSIIYDEKKNRFIFLQGAFTKAFEHGHWLLIDELSLAPSSVLQAIEAALDSKILTVQELGGTREIRMHPNFYVICTTNPNTKEYSRFNISDQFLDRFLKIYFENLSNEELEKIMIEKCQRKYIDDEIQKIIKTHIKYTGSHGPKCKNMYTLRELDRACILLEKDLDYFNSEKINDILYRSRAGEDLLTYNTNSNIFDNNPDIIQTKNRIKYIQLALDCLENGFNIIIDSFNNSGTTSFAIIIANEFIKKIGNSLPPLIVSMTKEIRVSDLTEVSIPVSEVCGEQREIKMKILKGVIYKAAEEGRVLIFDDLERGNTKVLESINDIYECNVLYQETNNIQRNITINKNFRIIYTMHTSDKHKISAAFLNRFIHIKMKDDEEWKSLNIKAKKFPDSVPIDNLNDLCQNANIAHTTQVEAIYQYTKASIESQIPVCVLGESGYGRNIAINLFLKNKFKDPTKINTIYCTSETTREMLIGNYSFDGRLLFNKGPLIRAATNGGVLIIKNIDKLTYHAYSCIITILNLIKQKNCEYVIPGFDLSEFKFSKEFYCIATIDGVDESKIPNYILKNFVIKKVPTPTEADYIEIYKSVCNDYVNHKTEFDTLVKCFLSCNDLKNCFDTSFRMFVRILISFERNYQAELLKEQAINIFALFQNAKTKNKENLIAKLSTKIDFNVSDIETQISSDVSIKNNQLVKGPLASTKIISQQLEILKSLSKEQLNIAFYLKICKTPIVLIGSTSFRETTIRQNIPNKIKLFNSTGDTTIDDLIGSISLKKNIQPTGRFKHGDIYDILIEYMSNEISTNGSITKLDLNSPESFEKVKEIIDQMDNGKLKPYFQYLINIIEHENEHATFFELGYMLREILLGNSVLLKNIDQLNENVIDSLIPFLNETLDLNEYIPGVTYSPQYCHLFFTCSEQGYEKLSPSFRSRVQAVYVGHLGKDDIKKFTDNNILLDAYDAMIHDYTDITRAINVIKIASVLNNFDSPDERISIANNIISLKSENFDETKIFGTLNENKNYYLEELIEYNSNTSVLKSVRTGAVIKVEKFNESEINKFVYVPSIACLLDLCIISIATHIPLIVESSPGQNKSTLIKKFGDAIGKAIENNMSKNKTSEYFIGQIQPTENGFNYEIGNIYNHIEKEYIYLINEINLSSSSVLTHFLTIFKTPYNESVVHPRCNRNFYKKFHLFATMNPAASSADREKLSKGFSSCSILYHMPTYGPWDNSIIISNIFNQYESILEDSEQSINFIVECHKKCSELSNDVTIRDMLKLAEGFKEIAKNEVKISREKIANLVQMIYSSKMKNWLEDFEKKAIEFKGTVKKIMIPNNITKPQFILMEQIREAINMNRGIIVRGLSGNGKTHCIKKLFNEFHKRINQKLLTLQLCSESDTSEMYGRWEPEYPDIKIMVKEISSIMLNILDAGECNDFEKELFSEYINELNVNDNTYSILKKMEANKNIMKFPSLSREIVEHLKEFKQFINFKYKNSPLIDAIENGHWVVLENINLCPGDILESLNSLLDENHSFRINDGKKDIVYSLTPVGNERPIHKDFRLFMTSDDRVLNTIHSIPAPFLSRCIVLQINSPKIDDLPNIARNYYDATMFADFLSKCFKKHTNNHVRDIIRMAQIYKILNVNPNTSKPEISIAKTLKFILNNNYSIPNTFIIPKREYDHLIKEILCIIQKNLFDDNLEDSSFSPWTEEYIKNIFINMHQSNQLNDLCQYLKATLKLACYVFARKSLDEFKSLTNHIGGKIITLLVCGYLISINDKHKEIPDFIWNLHFKPAIWDLLFIANDKYADFITKVGFKDFLRSGNDETGEFAFEFHQFSKLNTIDYEKNKEEFSEAIDSLFNRQIFNEDDEVSMINTRDKNLIVLEKLPLIFPCILDNKFILDTVNYDELIQIFNFLNLHPPFNELMKLFNYEFINYAIFNDYNFRYNNPSDLNAAKVYGHLLEYDHFYQHIKFISQIPKDSDDINDIIKNNLSKNNITMDLLINKIDEMTSLCMANKTEITESLMEIMNKCKSIIQISIQQKRDKDELDKKQIEILNKIKKLIQRVRNNFIKEEIEKLRSNNQLTDELYHQIEKLVLFDSHISKRNTADYIKYKYNCLQKHFIPDEICEKMKFSVIITSFIVQPACKNFLISPDVYSQFHKYSLMKHKIEDLIDEINLNALNNERINYNYLEQILKENRMNSFIPLKADILNKKNISKIIEYMDKFYINTCIVSNACKKEEYIDLMLNEINETKIFWSIKKGKQKKQEDIEKLINQYRSFLERRYSENDNDENNKKTEMSIDLLRLNVDIPSEDWGQIMLPWDEPYDNNSKAQLAHDLTKIDALESKITDYPLENVNLNNQEYQIIRIESLYYNYIYLTNLENIDQSVANDLGIINNYVMVKEPSNSLQILKKDIIIFLSKMKRINVGEKEFEVINKAIAELWEKDTLDIRNNSLHILYNPNFRGKIIQYLNEKKLFDDFKLKYKNYTTENEIKTIEKSIKDIKLISDQIYNEISSTYKYLLKYESKENQFRLEGISKRDEKNYVEKIQELGKIFLKYVQPRSSYNGKCIQISINENSFIKHFDKLSDIGLFREWRGRGNVYEEQSLNYDDQYVRVDKYNTFAKCYVEYSNWCTLNSQIYSIHNTNIVEYNFPRISNTVTVMSKQHYPNISNLCKEILNNIQSIYNTKHILEKIRIQREPEIPKIYFDNFNEPFHDICDHLLIENNMGKAQLLTEINYDLGYCYQNSQLKLNIINMSNATIRTKPDTIIEQTKESVLMTMNLSNENQEIELINNDDDSKIGLLKFKCKFIHPKIYFVFSSPVTLKNKIIYIKGIIYHQLAISILSKSSIISHHLQLDTLDGSELNKNEVTILNTNEKIIILFSEYGKFKANMQIIFSSNNFNINTLINIDVDVDPNEHSYIYDAKTLEEIKMNENLMSPSYLIVKSPLKPETEKHIQNWTNIKNIPYLHIIYANNYSIIKTLNSSVNLRFGESYFHIDLNSYINPKIINFEKSLCKWDIYFRYSGDNIYLIENIPNREINVKIVFQKNILEKLIFAPKSHGKKNYNQRGLYISKYNFENNNLDDLLKLIEDTQGLNFNGRCEFIPWINIIKLFEKTANEVIGTCIQNIGRIKNFFIRDDQTFYVEAKESSVVSIDRIPDFSKNKQISQTIKSKINIDTNEFSILKTIDPSNLFDIIANLPKIKLGIQFYRQIYESDIQIAANISMIYRSLKFLSKSMIMENTFNEVISIGDTLFLDDNQSSNIEIVHEKKESTENITFRYYKNKNKNETQAINDPNIDEYKNIISPEYNIINTIKPTDSITDTANKVLIILTGDDTREKEESKKKVTVKVDNKIKNEVEKNDDFCITPIEASSVDADEINAPRNALKKAKSSNSKHYELSNIELENKNVYLPDVEIIEGKNPNIDKYVIKVLECLVKYDFSIAIPENHITLVVDISFLSGSQNHNLFCHNLFVTMETLDAFGINFSVWMFADRNLGTCVKKPTDPYDNKRKTILREFYFLNRKNSETYPVSVLKRITSFEDDMKSSLFIIFSTFVSPQILTKGMNWEKAALSCIKNRNLICYVEPIQHADKETSKALNEAINESSFASFVKFRKNIYESIAELLMKIFSLSLKENKYQYPKTIYAESINLKSNNKFVNNSTFDSDIYVCKNIFNEKIINLDFSDDEQLQATQIHGEFEIIDSSDMDFGDLQYSSFFMYPYKPTRDEPSSKWGTIDQNGLLKFYITNGKYTKIFKQKTGEKVPDYIVNIVIDCSLIVSKYSLNHCFLSIVSILSSLKELEIPCVNIFAAGSELVTVLVNQDLRLISNSDELYSQIFNILIENASENRSLENAIKTAITHSYGNSTSKVMFVITDCLFGIEQERQIKDLLNFAQTRGTVIGIGTGPAPFKIEKIFSFGVWAKNPFMLRKALHELGLSSVTQNVFKTSDLQIGSELLDEIPNWNEDSPNSKLLEQFTKIEYYNPCIAVSFNEKAFGDNEIAGDSIINSSFDPSKDKKYEGIKILVMMFYQGKKYSKDEPITVDSFINGIPSKDGSKVHIKSPGEKLLEKGYEYKIVTKYKDSLEELATGTYSIAWLCTASKGISNGDNDENYFESFIKAIVNFFVSGGSLIMFAENPPFIFEINEILKALPGITVRIDDNKNNIDKDDFGYLHGSKGNKVGPGEFLNRHYTFSATINGDHYYELPSLGGGIDELYTGSTLAKFINIDTSFTIFSMTHKGNPSCIYRIPNGNEGVIIIDSAASKLFFEYTKKGTARYINNLPFLCIQCSHFRRIYDDFKTEAGIAIDTEIKPQVSNRFRVIRPLLISIIIDATSSMSPFIITCKKKLTNLINNCKEKVNELKIYLQFVAYRDICDIGKSNGMIENHEITNDPAKIQQFMNKVQAVGGGDDPENIAAGYETALDQIESCALDCNKMFIHLGDSPNHDSNLSGSHHKSGNEKGVSWDVVWKNIDRRIGEQNITKIITISCANAFDDQYNFWNKYNCNNINKALDKKSISTESLESIIEQYIPDAVATMYG